MKRRKNAVYTGKSKRVSMGRGTRALIDVFYRELNKLLSNEDEIEIISPDRVNPTHDLHEQSFIFLDYCVRKIWPEVTGLFSWGNEVTPRLRALAPIVDLETAEATRVPLNDAYDALEDAAESTVIRARLRAFATSTDDDEIDDKMDQAAAAAKFRYDNIFAAQYGASGIDYCAKCAADSSNSDYVAEELARGAESVARCVYYALVVCIEVEDEAAYNRIIDFTNEMLESL